MKATWLAATWRAALGGAMLLLIAGLAVAQNAADDAVAPPRVGPPYAAIKSVMQKLYDSGDKAIRSLYGKGDYDLYHCRNGSEYLGPTLGEDDTTASYANLAFDMVVWTTNLSKMRYPEAVWQAPLAGYEAGEVKLIAEVPLESQNEWTERRETFLRTLAEKLAVYRAHRTKLRKVVVDGGCGAGEINVSIATEPKGGQVLFIPTFFHELCKVQHLNPDDAAACTRWREAVDGTLSQVSGDYLYQVRWPDGTTRKGKLSFNKIEDGQTVTLRKP